MEEVRTEEERMEDEGRIRGGFYVTPPLTQHGTSAPASSLAVLSVLSMY